MNLSQRSKIALGIATILEVVIPLLIVFLYMLVFFMMPIMMATNPNSEGPIFGIFFIGLLLFSFIMIFFAIFQIVLKVLYLTIVIRNKRSTDLIKILFVLGTFYLPYIAMPLYYILIILKENTEGEGTLNIEDTVSPA